MLVLKIGVSSAHGLGLKRALQTKREMPSAPVAPPQPTPAGARVVDLLNRLQLVPRQTVSFQASKDLEFALRGTPRPGIESVHASVFPHN
jgi:hypothetical protein